MKYTIEGFSQKHLINLGLDLTDALILRWFIDFKDTGKMAYEIINNDKFYWVKYDSVLKDLPILDIEKRTLARKFLKMSESGVLKHFTKKEKGTFSMYAVGEEYAVLVSYEEEGSILESIGTDLKVLPLVQKSTTPSTKKSEQKINLLKDPSTKYQSTKDTKTLSAEIENFFEECWKLYPSKVGVGKVTIKAKNNSYKIGEEFKRCIQRYVAYVDSRRKTDFKELKYQNGSTFWNSGYLDFLDKNYTEFKQNYNTNGFKPTEYDSSFNDVLVED